VIYSSRPFGPAWRPGFNQFAT